MKYLLTTGKTTEKVEEYIEDLFKLYLNIYPGDIPHLDRLGFDFLMTGIMKNNLRTEVESRINTLIKKISSVIPKSNISIEIESLTIIDESRATLVLNINGTLSDDIEIDLYKN